MDNKRCLISIVSPVFKAEKIIDELIKRVSNSVSKITDSFEIILVDDFSPDSSWGVIKKNCKADKRVKGIKLSRNFGQHYAITAGLEASCGDYVVVMDCDLQDDPEYIHKMYEKAKEGYDIVYTRMKTRSHSFVRNICSDFYNSMINLLSEGLLLSTETSTFSMLTRKAVNAFGKVKDFHRYYLLVLHWLGFKSAFIEVDHAKRFEGKSSYGFLRLFELAIDGVISQSTKLLRISIALGFFLSFVALILLVFIVFLYCTSGLKQGWPSIVCLILLSTGIILISNGILGVYLGKTFEQAKNRPLYLIDEQENL